MVDRIKIREEVWKGLEVEVLETGRWYIADGEYEDYSSAAQGESRQEAITTLVKRLAKRKYRELKNEEKRKERQERMKKDRELMDKKIEHHEERMKEERARLEEYFEESS